MNKIQADFNAIEDGMIQLSNLALDSLSTLKPGDEIILHDGSMEVKAILERRNNNWFGIPNWNTKQRSGPVV